MSEKLPLNVAEARAAVLRADEIADEAQACRPPDEQTLSLLSEELLGHLLVLLASVEEDYKSLSSGTRLRPVVAGASRAAGDLLARPGIGTLADVLVLAAVCRLMLAWHQVHPLVGGVEPALAPEVAS
ncbi:hypothetical protein [Streptomyces sp. Y1]|uniref:Uncharacterized protein n=1 Tax=Streptomyces sp. Y1 TaxID=3238634 RepID=A0AB39TX80_9ACTN